MDGVVEMEGILHACGGAIALKSWTCQRWASIAEMWWKTHQNIVELDVKLGSYMLEKCSFLTLHCHVQCLGEVGVQDSPFFWVVLLK